MEEQNHIRDFVQKVLGCTCPDKVFEQIEDIQIEPSVSPHTRSITIGGRLLIYIWEVKKNIHFKENFLALLAAGRQEWDERGLNRFRAVLAADAANQTITAEATKLFSLFADRDDRMHLHIVPGNIINEL